MALVAFVGQLWAQESLTQNIRGTVTDATTNMPLPGATVMVVGSDGTNGTITDAFGNFVIKDVEIGRRSIEVSFVGFQKAVVPNLLLETGREARVEVTLKEDLQTLGEVTVKASKPKDRAQNEMAVISARTFSVEETERFAGSLGDPARMVANYAGVMTQNDSRNDIIIRGNSPAGVLWRLEGVEIANPNHFAASGTTGGPISMINNNLLANSDFLTGAFPAEYGNALAGAFDLKLRSGNRDKMEFVGQVGFNGFEVGAEGPLAKLGNGQKASFLANFRYSTMEVMDELGFDMGTGTAIPRYKDLTFMVDLPGTKIGRFKLFGLWGQSDINLGREYEDEDGNSYASRGTAVDFGSDLAIVGLTHTLFVGEKTSVNSAVSYQSAFAHTVMDSIKMPNYRVHPRFRGNQKEERVNVSTNVTHKASSRNIFKVGATGTMVSASYLDSLYLHEDDRFRRTTDLDGELYVGRAHGQWQYKFSNSLSSFVGVHGQYVNQADSWAVEPRLALQWEAAPGHQFKLGYGLHSQMQTVKTYFHREYDRDLRRSIETNNDLGLTRSHHYVLGYDLRLNSVARLKLETYYQHLYDVPVTDSLPEYSLANSGDSFGGPGESYLKNEGLGRNYGVELTLERFLSSGYYFLLTTSVFDSKYTGSDGKWRNTAFNGNYVVNLLGGYEFRIGKKSMLTIDLKSVFAGGRRYVPIDLEASEQQNAQEYDWSRAYEDQYDPYFRTDVRIGFKFNSRRYSQEWAVDLQNVSNYQSIFNEAYDVDKGEVYKTYQQGFLPMVLYRIRF